MSNILVYELDKKIYINLTNRCTNECIFCLRQDKDDVCGQELWLDSEDFTSEDVIVSPVILLNVELIFPPAKNPKTITAVINTDRNLPRM